MSAKWYCWTRGEKMKVGHMRASAVKSSVLIVLFVELFVSRWAWVRCLVFSVPALKYPAVGHRQLPRLSLLNLTEITVSTRGHQLWMDQCVLTASQPLNCTLSEKAKMAINVWCKCTKSSLHHDSKVSGFVRLCFVLRFSLIQMHMTSVPRQKTSFNSMCAFKIS